ncbi:hypothetical protein [Haemophilus paracuniculus]|uniref:hypothetical protein n=1 Tax=Haemophilus paracuniculus TaxID=734 RepID=UPI0013010488|nr:hypothetical protein [Haemophilus paracuniculus]
MISLGYSTQKSVPQKVQAINQIASQKGASGNIVENKNGKLDYTNTALTKDNLGTTISVSVDLINSSNKK